MNKYTAVWIYWLFCGIVPVSSVVLYYEPYGQTYVKIYGALFIYPLIFGWITIIFGTNIYYFLKQNVFKDNSREKELWGGIILFSLILLALELNSSNIGPFEINREKLQETIIENPQTGEKIELITYFEKRRIDKPKQVECFVDSGSENDVRCVFQESMLETIGDKWIPREGTNWSPIRYLYIVSFIIQSAALLFFIFGTAFVLQYRIVSAKKITSQFYNLLIQIIASIVVAFFWIVLRVAFIQHKIYYYPGKQNYVAEYVVLIMFCVVLLLLAIIFWRKFSEIILAIAGIAFGGGGVFVIFNFSERLEEAYSPSNIISSSVISLLGLAAVGYCLFILRDAREG